MLKLNSELVRELLAQRFAKDLHKSLSTIPKPYIFKDMQKAASKIAKAVKNGDKIAVVGDYDVDGIISSTIIDEFFQNIGVNITVKIPNRFKDGYGITPKIIQNLDADLIITVDNGICAHEAAELCKELDIDLIITDHHEPPEILPDAYAIVNPKRLDCEFSKHTRCEICGAQVAWWLCGAIKSELKIDYNMADFLDLLSIAIVADMMDLTDLNHLLVRRGLADINKLKRPAFIVLKEKFKKKFFDFESIPFFIAPLLNASGRMDDASISYKFLRSSTYEEANKLLDVIERLNTQRKEQEQQGYEESKAFVRENDQVLVTYSANWHKGILGIVASRLVRDYNKPSFVFNIDNEIAKGSARSAQNIDILEILRNCEDLLTTFGGHKSAAGLSLHKDKLKDFYQRVNQITLKVDEFCDTENTLGELELSEINMKLIKILSEFEPFGQGNEKPYFVSKNVIVHKPQLLKNKHLKCYFSDNKSTISAIYFNCDRMLEEGEIVNIHYSISLNYFHAKPSIQLMVDNIF